MKLYQTCQLKLICLCVCDITKITATVIKAIYQRSVFSVVTDDCHAKFDLVSHITENSERCDASFSIRIDDVRTTWSCRIAEFDITAGLFPKKQIKLQYQTSNDVNQFAHVRSRAFFFFFFAALSKNFTDLRQKSFRNV